MKFSVGDPVYIKSNNEEGVIIEVIDKNTAKVRANGISFHAFFEDLEHPYLRWFLNKKKDKGASKIFIDNIQKEKANQRQSGLSAGVYLVFFPQYKTDDFDEVVDKVKIFFYNETNNEYNFSYVAKGRHETYFELENQMLPGSEFYIHDLSFDVMASTPLFMYKLTDKNDAALEVESHLALKPKKLYEYLNKIRYDNHAFFAVLLFDKIEPKPYTAIKLDNVRIHNISKVKENHFDFSQVLQKSRYEIDLHIEKLVSDSGKLSSAEKLNVQLKEFEKALELAYVTHQRSVVFIHGVGKGTLKAEIHKILLAKKQTKTIKTYVNNYDMRYGYGATEVFF